MDGQATLLRILLSVVVLFEGCLSDVKCRNDDGDEVDWYILYKYPKGRQDGLSYLYMDEYTTRWNLSTEKINSKSGSMAHTLKPLFDYYDNETQDFGFLLYNDQPGKSVSSSFGHSKGIVMLNRSSGVWISHSTPNFPIKRSKNFWPDSGNRNGQTFLCVTFAYDQFKLIGKQLRYIHVRTYDSYIPPTFHNELQWVAGRNRSQRMQTLFNVVDLTSMSGHRFRSFAKHKRFGDDIYSGLIVQEINEELFVKSWGSGGHNHLESNCSTPENVYNVKRVKLPHRDAFVKTVDHSKWCVSSSWTCIADMNRETSQMKRGGGAICIEAPVVAEIFNASISQYEDCPSISVTACSLVELEPIPEVNGQEALRLEPSANHHTTVPPHV